MIEKYFGAVENKEEFLNELFPDDSNILCDGQISDKKSSPTEDLSNAEFFDLSLTVFNESIEVTANKDDKGINFWYRNQHKDSSHIIFDCKSVGSKNIFGVGFSHDYFGDLSMEKINHLIKTEESIKHILKGFTEPTK